jgi:L-lactate dehydrogenase complex protein LldF
VASSPNKADFFEASRAGVADRELRRKLENASGRHLEHVAEMREDFLPFEAERDTARRIKEDTIAHLDQYLIELKRKLEANGCIVFFAADAEQARDYIMTVAKKNGVKRVAKGKSMTTEEIGLNNSLMRIGIEVTETDLGEYIVQLRHEPPSHILTPAIHLSKEDIGALFADKLHVPYTSEPEALTAYARTHLRPIFLTADMGITGVNFAIAETGTLVVLENEGNGRLSSTLPETFIGVMGIEKVIPKLSDVSHFLEILARTATGQKLTTYTNFINGPRRAGEIDGPREVHVVILDNGRSAMIADPVMREALYCIRCGACLNVCPVYRRVGGHAYGSTYPGPIGSIISPGLFGSVAGHLPFASTLCGACRDICPVRIDIPRLLLHLRWKGTEGQGGVKWPRAAERVRAGARRYARLARYPRTIRALGRIGALLLRPLSREGWIKWMPPPFSAWTRIRDFPRPHPHHLKRMSDTPVKNVTDTPAARDLDGRVP